MAPNSSLRAPRRSDVVAEGALAGQEAFIVQVNRAASRFGREAEQGDAWCVEICPTGVYSTVTGSRALLGDSESV